MAVGNGRATAGERGESRTTMRWPVVAASVALHNPGRRLLDHCWDSLGGAHVDVDPLASNATSTGEDDSGGTHMDPLVTRLLFWLVYTLAAVILLVSMLRIFPPPDRVFPRKRPVAGVELPVLRARSLRSLSMPRLVRRWTLEVSKLKKSPSSN